MKILYNIIAIILLTSLSDQMIAQPNNSRVKSAYLFNFAKNVNWTKGITSDKFVYGVYGNPEVFEDLKKIIEGKSMKDKTIDVLGFRTIDDLKPVNVIFIDEKYNYETDLVVKYYKNKSTLIITDNFSDKELVMINFLPVVGGKQPFEVNKTNIIFNNMEITPQLLLLGGTEIDVRDLYKKSETKSEELKKKLDKQEALLEQSKKELDKQKAEIEKQKSEIVNQRDEIAKQKQSIVEQQQQIGTQKAELDKLLQNISAQDKILQDKLAILSQQETEIKAKENLLAQQKEEEKKQREKLALLDEEIAKKLEENNKQKTVIGEQGETIETQKGVIYLFFGFSILIIAVIFLIYRSFQIKKRANIKIMAQKEEIQKKSNDLLVANTVLQEQKEEIQQQAEELFTQSEALMEVNKELDYKNNDIQKSFTDMKTISDFGKSLTSVFELKLLDAMIYRNVTSLMPVDNYGLGVFNSFTNAVEFNNFIENGIQLQPFRRNIADTQSMAVYCYLNKEMIFSNDYEIDHKKWVEQLAHTDIATPQSVVYLPLTINNKSVGVLTVQSLAKKAYSEKDILNLETLASYISIAIDNSSAYQQVSIKNEQITSSINYAKTIQSAILPSDADLNLYMDAFVLYKPKDIVAGDFYWFYNYEENNINTCFYIVADCTGHGVPGAFMSMIGNNVLNQVIKEMGIFNPAEILSHLNIGIQKALRQKESKNNDGMDIGICKIEIGKEYKCTYAAAKRTMYVYDATSNQINKFRGDRINIGGVNAKTENFSFTNTDEIILKKGDTVYLSSDGYADQNNPDRRSFGSEKFMTSILISANKSMEEQKQIFFNALAVHQQDAEQRDDITLMGIRRKI